MSAHVGEIIDIKDGVEILDCKTCGFIHVNPIPSIEELQEFYRHDFYEKDKPLSIPHKVEVEPWLNLQYADRFDTFEQHVQTDQPSILDIGSGAGFFLKLGQKRGWKTLGLEPSAQAAAFARNQDIEVIEAIFSEDISHQLGLFDVVHASLVLEHVPDPRSLILNAHKITKPGGLLCVSTPNDYNPLQRTLREVENYEPWWLCPKHHLNYFTPESLKALIKSCGYTHMLSESSFPIDMFLLMGDNYIGNQTLGRACHSKRKNFESTMNKAGLNKLKRKLYQNLADLNLGREICVYAMKT